MFVAVGLAVSWVVDITARRTKQAARANAESELLVTTAGSILRGQGALDALLERTREAFGMRSACLLERERHRRERRPGADGRGLVAASPAPARPR